MVLWMHLGGFLSTQEARVALGYRLVQVLRFFCAWQPPACIHNSMVVRCTFTILLEVLIEKGSAAVSCDANRTKTVCRTVEHMNSFLLKSIT